MMLTLVATLAAMPWLQGFSPSATTVQPSKGAVAELTEWQPAEDQCSASAYGGFELTVDDQRVLASYTQGIVVLDNNKNAVAHTPPFTCQGSADDIVALQAGDAWIGTPVLAFAATTGGKNESITWLTLYRMSDLAPVFTGIVERHQGQRTRTGIVLVYPGGLLYQPPTGAPQVWRFDADQHRYINTGEFMAPNA
jgi:hypothetical protein